MDPGEISTKCVVLLKDICIRKLTLEIPRGILDYALTPGNASIAWKLTGNLGGEHACSPFSISLTSPD